MQIWNRTKLVCRIWDIWVFQLSGLDFNFLRWDCIIYLSIQNGKQKRHHLDLCKAGALKLFTKHWIIEEFGGLAVNKAPRGSAAAVTRNKGDKHGRHHPWEDCCWFVCLFYPIILGKVQLFHIYIGIPFFSVFVLSNYFL